MTNSSFQLSNNNFDFLSFIPVPVVVYQKESLQFLAINKEAIQLYGYSEDEFLNMKLNDIWQTVGDTETEIICSNFDYNKGIKNEVVYRHKNANGNTLYVQIKCNSIPYRGIDAEIITITDLTTRYEKQQKILAQKDYLKAIGNISQIWLKSTDWMQSLYRCFEIIGEIIEVDRIYFFENNLKNETTSQKLEWNRTNIEPEIDNPLLQDAKLSDSPLIINSLKEKKHFEAIVNELPPSWSKSVLEAQNIKSALTLPIFVDEEFYGFIGFDDCKKYKRFSEDEFQLLYALTSNLAQVLKSHKAYQELSFSEGKYKSLIENGNDLVAILDKNGNYKYVAPSSKTVLGIDATEFIGKSAFDFVYEEDLPRVKHLLSKIQNKKYISIEPYRFPDAQGNLRWVRTELSNHLNTPLIEGIVANTHDVTDEIKQTIINNLVTEISLAIAKPNSLVTCLHEALKKLVKVSKICMSEIWLIAPDNSQLNLITKAYQKSDTEAFHFQSLHTTNFRFNEGLPGRVWKEKNKVVWENLPKHKKFLRTKAAKIAKLSSGIGFPIIYADQFLGCIICFSKDSSEKLTEQICILSSVIQKLGIVIKQKLTEEEYRNFFNISPDPRCVVGFDGYIKKCNKAFISLIGFSKKHLYTTPISNFIHPDDKDKVAQSINSLIQGQSSEPFKGRLIASNGEVKWLLCSATALTESKTIIAVGKDITEQTLAEKKLKTAYERLKTAQKIAKLGYWYREINSDVSVWSEETYAIYEYQPETFTPTKENLLQTFKPADRYLISDDPAIHLTDTKVQSFEHEIITSSGKSKWVRQEVQLITDEKGTPVRIEGTIQDITERKEYEKQLHLSNEVFILAMKASNELIWNVDLTTNQLIRRKNHNQTFDYNLSETFSIENSWFTAIDPSDRLRVWASLESALKNKTQETWREEYKIILTDGSVSYVVDRCNILRDQDGNAVRLVGAALDVSVSRGNMERIKKQNEALREIAWTQSHIIRSPLTRIMGLVYLSKELGGGGLTIEEIMELIMDAVNELDEVIQQITYKTNLINEENIIVNVDSWE